MREIRCFIVDDEPPAIALIEKYIDMVDMLTLVGTSQSAVKAFDAINNSQIDLLFLDIQMPFCNGIDFIKTLKHPPSIILTTAYREYALDGYDLDNIDYLLKPISFDRFLKAITRYQERHKTSAVATDSEPTITQAPDHIFFNINKTNHKVIIGEIIYIESLRDYVRIHTTEDALVVRGNLGTTMKLLPQDKFVRIHRSFAVATKRIKAYNQTSLQVGDQQLLIGASYRENVLNRLKNT